MGATPSRVTPVEDVTDAQRDTAWGHLRAAAGKFGVEMQEGSWRALMTRAPMREDAAAARPR